MTMEPNRNVTHAEKGMELHPHYAPQIVGQEEDRMASNVAKILKM